LRAGRADARAGASKSLAVNRSARLDGAGGSGMEWIRRSWEVEKQCRKSEKAALSQGGFFGERGCKLQRHADHYA